MLSPGWNAPSVDCASLLSCEEYAREGEGVKYLIDRITAFWPKYLVPALLPLPTNICTYWPQKGRNTVYIHFQRPAFFKDIWKYWILPNSLKDPGSGLLVMTLIQLIPFCTHSSALSLMSLEIWFHVELALNYALCIWCFLSCFLLLASCLAEFVAAPKISVSTALQLTVGWVLCGKTWKHILGKKNQLYGTFPKSWPPLHFL